MSADQAQPLIAANPDSAQLDNDNVDFNNPPLRRMRTSLVNRRRLAEMRENEVIDKYL